MITNSNRNTFRDSYPVESPFLCAFRFESMRPFGLVIHSPREEGDDHKRDIADIPQIWLEERVQSEKLVVLRGFNKMSRDEFLNYCKSFPGRQVLDWDFGPVMEMRETNSPKNYLFSREKVPFHWDGAFHKVPSYLMFNCIEAPTPGAGGETLFCNTEKIWSDSTIDEKKIYLGVELKYETKKVAHYGGQIQGPLVQYHPATGKPILRFAEPVETALNPVNLTIKMDEGEKQKEFLDKMSEKIYGPAYCYAHVWQAGDLLVADNHSLIHGRTEFKINCPRHLRRIQLL